MGEEIATEVEAIDNSKKKSEILGPTSDEATVQMDQLEDKCYWNDAEFSTSEKSEQPGLATNVALVVGLT